MNSLVISYFGQTTMAHSAEEAKAFVNNLKYRGSGGLLKCTGNCEKFIDDFFACKKVQFRPLTTHGCSTSRVLVFPALASNLEEHSKLFVESENLIKEQRQKLLLEKREKALSDMYKQQIGRYSVSLVCTVCRIYGSDGVRVYSFNVFAQHKMEAFDKAVAIAREEGVKDSNVSFVYDVNDNWESADIEFFGKQ